MGCGEAEALSTPFSPQDAQGAITGWLSKQQQYDGSYQLLHSLHSKYNVGFDNRESTWLPQPPSCTQYTDLTSIASVDDDVSVSDSAHGSASSEASSHTSWTSTTESSDTFPDEDLKEQLPQLSRPNSYTVVEPQELTLSGIRSSDHPTLGSAIRSVNEGVSRPLRAPDASSKSWGTDVSSAPNVQHCRSRRSACLSVSSCPPKLKRDTDVTDQFVALLIIFAKRLITAIWPSSDCPPMNSDCFGAGVLPLETFIRETLRRSKTSFSTLQVALYYLVLLKSRSPTSQASPKCKSDTTERGQCRAMQCGRRMFLSALMLASKYLQDRNYSARAWSKISGLRSHEINKNEREYLAKINYDLHMTKESFENWSRIVLVLSRLSNERPCFRPVGPFDVAAGFSHPAASFDTSLAAMVSQTDFDEDPDYDVQVFTSAWWTALLWKLEPGTVKDKSLVDQFLQTYLPSNKLPNNGSLPHMKKDDHDPSDVSLASSSSISHAEDLNFGDLNNARNCQWSGTSTVSALQTPTEMSSASGSALPRRPQLENLPTPQTTPRISCHFNGETGFPREPLHLAASMDSMPTLRKQCFKNANLERCPPPRPQTVVLPSMKSLMRSAESNQDSSYGAPTPLTSSPASVSSDSTTLTGSTCQSRSLSISSLSSWASLGPTIPHLRRSVTCGLSSPLSRVCSISDKSCISVPINHQTMNREVQAETHSASTSGRTSAFPFRDQTYVQTSSNQSSEMCPSRSEVAAIHGLMSLSTQSETSSQSVTPTPQRLSEQGINSCSKTIDRLKHQKRKLSKTEPNLQAQVRDLVWGGSWAPNNNILRDPQLPYYGAMHREMQVATSLRKENRRPMSTPLNNKRLCAWQDSSCTATTIPLPDRSKRRVFIR